MAAALSFDSAYRALKRDALAPVYYLTGDEELLKDEIIALLVERTLDSSSRDFNFDVRSATDLSGEALHALVETLPMLAERRVVVVKNLEQWRKNAKVWQVLLKYLERPSPRTVLVLSHGAGEKPDRRVADKAEHVILHTLAPHRVQRWIARRAEQTGFGLTEEAAEHLQSAVGADLAELASEIEKLGAAVAENETIGAERVAAFVGVRRGETLHDWVDAVLLRETARAIEMLHTVLSGVGVTGVRLVNTLGIGLIGVKLAVAMHERGHTQGRLRAALFDAIRTARPFGLRGWKDEAALWASAADRWTGSEAREAIRAAYDCDVALKSTTLTGERGNIIDMLLRMSGARATT